MLFYRDCKPSRPESDGTAGVTGRPRVRVFYQNGLNTPQDRFFAVKRRLVTGAATIAAARPSYDLANLFTRSLGHQGTQCMSSVVMSYADVESSHVSSRVPVTRKRQTRESYVLAFACTRDAWEQLTLRLNKQPSRSRLPTSLLTIPDEST